MNATSSHPSTQVLAAFRKGTLSQADAAKVEQHLQTCAACRRAVEGHPDSLGPTAGADAVVGATAATLPPLPAPNPPAKPEPVPTTLPPQLMDHPRYQIVRELGRGGMGTVYEAVHKMMHRRVALKIISSSLLSNAEAIARFHSEVENAARLAHQNIVTAHDAEQVGDLHMLVTEYVEGTDLATVLKQRGPLPIAEACRYVQQAALGLQHAHEKGMIHRDIKPANLMLTPRSQVKILDFGLARLTGDQGQGEGLTKANAFMGTPEYVAPEQANDARHADIRSDIYSLGCTLYCLLTGRPPFVGPTALIVVMAQVEKEPAPVQQLRAAVPAELSAVVMKMLQKAPAQRYQTPLEVARALMPFCPGKGQMGKAKAVSAGCPTVAAEPAPPSPAVKAPARKVSSTPAAPLTEPALPVSERKRKGGKPTAGRSSRRLLLVAGAVAAMFLIVLLSIIIIRTPSNGQLIIETDDPSVEVVVKKDGATIIDRTSKREINLKAGEYEIELAEAKEGLRLSTKAFTLERNGKAYVKVTLEKQAKQLLGTLPTRYKNGLGMEFVLVPQGKFLMGGYGGSIAKAKEVEIPYDFYLGVYEVTQEEWQTVTGQNPSSFSRTGFQKNLVKDIPDEELKRFPVELVSWYDAQLFLEMLNSQEKEAGWVYRLPKDAEWEYACRGGPRTNKFDYAYSYYFDKPTNQLQPEQANISRKSQRTCKVGSYKSNSLGLHDMHGNVREWCEDEMRTSEGASHRVYRSGDWRHGGAVAALSRDVPPSQRFYAHGLRLARVPAGRFTIQFLGLPVDAMVEAILDGKLIKLANLKDPLSLGLGDHQLEVSRTGYKTVKLPFKVQPGENPPLRVELMRDEKAPPDQSSQPAKYKNSLGMEFALVGKGTAWLGGGGGRPGQRKVEIPYDFYLGVYEVTQEEWQKVTGTNPSWFSRQGQKKDSVKNVTDEELRRFPVENVSWDDAQAFLKQLTKQVSEPGWVYRLPKSIEWEYACRGGPLAIELGYDFHYYFEKPTNELRPDQASYGDSHLGLCKVGSFKPNSLGLYDLHGNVSEWTDDIRDLGDGVSYRVIRGGSCSSLASSVRTASGNWKPLSFRHYTCGLRLARVPVGSEGQIKVSGQGKKPTEEDTEAPEPE